jgi:hypothetical protein
MKNVKDNDVKSQCCADCWTENAVNNYKADDLKSFEHSIKGDLIQL